MRTCQRGSPQDVVTGFISPFPESPTRAANIRVRRSLKLLQSTARAGYTIRMRQIFEDAGNDYPEQQNDTAVLYPQLPNISRKAAPSPLKSPNRNGAAHQATVHASPTYRPESLCLSTKLSLAVPAAGTPHASLLYLSERSSGSWSDDSGYIVTTRSRSCSPVVPLNERIHTWLLELPDREMSPAQNDTEEKQQLASDASRCYDTNDPIVCGTSIDNNQEPSPFVEDPFVYNGNTPSRFELHENGRTAAVLDCRSVRIISDSVENSKPLEEVGVQVSPLSPNVCVERGPSRYHSTRKSFETSNVATPSETRFMPTFQAPQLKENVVRRKESEQWQW
jgi:hypothetical protein